MSISIHTSVDDLTSSFRCSIEHYEVKDFEKAIEEENKWRKRTTVIKLLERAKRCKIKGAKHI